MIRKFISCVLIISSISLTACSSSGNSDKNKQKVTLNAPTKEVVSDTSEETKVTPTIKPQIQAPAKPVTAETQSIDRAMQIALKNAETAGNKRQVAAILGQLYSRNPNDEMLAMRYARSLREANQLAKAKNILSKFTSNTNNVDLLSEMAMIELSSNNFETAKKYATRAIEIDPNTSRAYLALGTAQDALEDHASAEQSFRNGLRNWEGDPSPILNNLALNLASQGHLNEALSLLERALKISPKRMELERNRRIISTLLETANPLAPSPPKKPDVVIPNTAIPNTSKKPEVTNIYNDEPPVTSQSSDPVVPKIKLTPINDVNTQTQTTLNDIIEETIQ
jgi:Flp pilus assembly protein TadD